MHRLARARARVKIAPLSRAKIVVLARAMKDLFDATRSSRCPISRASLSFSTRTSRCGLRASWASSTCVRMPISGFARATILSDAHVPISGLMHVAIPLNARLLWRLTRRPRRARRHGLCARHAIIFFDAHVPMLGLALVPIFFDAHVPVFDLARVAFVPLGIPRDARRKDPFPACHTVSNRISSLVGTLRASLFLLPHKTLTASSAGTVLICHTCLWRS